MCIMISNLTVGDAIVCLSIGPDFHANIWSKSWDSLKVLLPIISIKDGELQVTGELFLLSRLTKMTTLNG